MQSLTELNEWHELAIHQQEIASQRMRDWFAADKERFSRFSLSCGDIFLDYSRNLATEKTIQLLCNLAEATGLANKINGLFMGDPVNNTENRPALHTALRDRSRTSILVNDRNIAPVITETQEKLIEFVKKIHNHQWRGVTGKPIDHIVNIGIGGSYTGPMMCTEALQEYAVSKLKFHFISSVDKVQLNDVLLRINPETTLFIISSKSFSTIETLTNAETVIAWMKSKLGADVLRHHFIAVTAVADKALRFGIQADCIFPLWDWVGGRYSVWSAIGLPLMLMLGNERFDEFLEGAYAIDQHFRHAAFSENIPVLLALLGIWYNNFFSANTQAIVPYAHRLRYFIPYLQQAEMESNGKRVSQQGDDLTYATGPVIFGEEGVIGQHAYHQLLHQGQHLIPVDFILTSVDDSLSNPHDDILLASALGQANALMRGKTYEEAQAELIANGHSAGKAAELARHQIIPGNKPSNLICMHHLTPRSLGALLALYEHKIFVQGAIWGINSFDQWGVELGKQLLPAILRHINGTARDEHIDAGTADFIHHLRNR